MSIVKNEAGDSLHPLRGKLVVNETYKVGGSTFNAAASPLTIDVSGSLTPVGGKPMYGNRGYVKVDGTGDLQIRWSNRSTNYMDTVTLREGEAIDLTGMKIDHLQIIHSGTDTNFRVLVF